MRIVLMPSAFYPSLGGVEELTRQLALELIATGHSVLIVTERWPRSLKKKEECDGLRILRFPMRVATGRWKANVNSFLTSWQIRRSLEASIKAFNPDVIHCQCVSSTTHYALHLRAKLRIPLIVTLQGELTMDANGIFQKPGIAQCIMQNAMQEADVVTGCSAKTIQDAADYLRKRPSRKPVRVVFNAACPHDFADVSAHIEEKPYVFALGRMVPQKGFDLLIHAFAKSAVHKTHLLVLAGDGPEKKKHEILCQELGLNSCVKFLGRTNRLETASLFAGCSLFVLPSVAHEGLPIVCAEAMAAGKPIVATRSGGTPEMIVNEDNGLLVSMGSVTELSNAMDRVLSNSALANKLAEAAFARSKTFSWSRIVQDYVSCYRIAIDTNCSQSSR